MTDHPKPIARYDCRPYHTGYMEKWDCGEFYAVEDIDPLLAAKDARIAELERDLKGMKFTSSVLQLSKGHAQRKLESLRTAIEAKARELLELEVELDNAKFDDAIYEVQQKLTSKASDLLALLEKKP